MRGGREPTLVGCRVILRPLHAGDFVPWQRIRRRDREWLERWEPLPESGSPDPVGDLAAFQARCSTWERQRHFDTAYGFGIFLTDGTLVGEISIGSVFRGPFQSAFVGYWIASEAAGRGLVPEAMALVLRFGFEELDLHRMEAVIVPRNRASRRVAEKLGLRDEGIARRFLQIRGVWEDHVRYAMTGEEWSERKTELEDQFLVPAPHEAPPA